MSEELTRKEFESRLIQRACEDAAFKKMLVKDAKAAIKQEFGENIPKDMTISIHEEEANTYHFVIPWNPFRARDDELSDDDLEFIAGGTYDCTDVILHSAMCTVTKHR